jgi:hypothetical protein
MGDQHMKRREFLRAAGVAIGLPFFPSLHPGSLWADPPKPPVRLLFLCVPLGFVPNQSLFKCPMFAEAGAKGWLPDQDGPLSAMPEVHAALEPYREHVSFLRGLSNRKYRADVHRADDTFLTSADTLADPARAATNTVSCDQVAAASDALGGAEVRHRSLSLGTRTYFGSSSGGLSWIENGVPIPPMRSPVQVFDLLFGKDDVPAETRLLRLRQRRSVLDATLGQVRDLDRELDAADRAKLDEVLSAVRSVESRIQREETWLTVPKPPAPFARPGDTIGFDSSVHMRTTLDLAHAAFLTDSTRVISYAMPSSFSEVSHFDKHALNHDLTPERAADAPKVDRAMSDEIAAFVKKLCDSREHDGQPLIHHTAAAYGAAVWGPNHSLKDLPIMLIGHGGGKIKQGATRRYDEPTPLANLWLTMLTAAGVDVPGGRFADSTGTLADLL